jgi:hypothetical protein
MGKFTSALGPMLALALTAGGWAGQAHANVTLVTSVQGFTGTLLHIDSGYSNFPTYYSADPIQLAGGISVTSDTTATSVGPVPGGLYLGSNGFINKPIVSSGDDYNAVTLTFATPVSGFGAVFNYIPDSGFGSDPTLLAFDAAGNEIGDFDLAQLAPISTPGGVDQMAFRGIQSDAQDIASIQFFGSQIAAGAVPEPSAWLLMIVGVFSVGSSLRVARRRMMSPTL